MKEIPFTQDFVQMHLKKYHEKVLFVRNKADRKRLFELLSL
jgi:hypothetical protein